MSDDRSPVTVTTGFVTAIIVILIFAYNKVDCAIGVQAACAIIEESYSK